MKTQPIKVILDNGLTVLFLENHTAPAVAVQVWIRSGSADETSDTSGIAHLHEHMLFKGTAKRGVGRAAKDIESSGGEINAWTSFDETVFHVVIPSSGFEKGLDVLADLVTNPAFNEIELAKEEEVVKEEIRQSADNPSRKVFDELFRTAYMVHPYGRPVLGSEKTVGAIRRADLVKFHGKWCTPSNTFVVIAGDIDSDRAIRLVKNAFAGYTGGTPERKRQAEPEHSIPSAVLQREKVIEVQLAAGWHIPGIEDPDAPILDLISVIVGQGDSSWLYREVRREKGLVNDIQTLSYTPIEPGLFVLAAGIPASKLRVSLPDIYKVFFSVVFERVQESELQKAKNAILSESIYQKETVQGQARKIGYLELTTRDQSFEDRYRHAIMDAAPEDLINVARKYFSPGNMSVVAIIPDEKSDPMLAEFSSGELLAPARTAYAELEKLYTPSSKTTGGIFKKKLANGISLVIQENHSVPLVAVRAVFPGGILYENPKNSGISSFTGRMLTKGTGRFSAEDIARETDSIAGSVSGFSGRNSAGVRAEFPSRNIERGIELFLDCLVDPRFPDSEIEKEKILVKEEIRNREDELGSLAMDLFLKTLFVSHPYGMDPIGTEKSVDKFDGARIGEFYKKYFSPSNLTIVITGDVIPEKIAEMIESRTGKWNVPKPSFPSSARVEPAVKPRQEVRYKEKEQAHIVLGFTGTTIQDPDRYAMEILTTMIGSQSGRLFMELREKRSLAYTVSAFSFEGLEPGYIAIYLSCAPDKVKESVESIKNELVLFMKGPIDESEIERTKNYLAGVHELSLQRNSFRAAQIAFNEAYGLGIDEALKYTERIRAVNSSKVLEIARKYFQMDKFVLAVIRPQGSKNP